jgi:hypothetical protein
MSRFVGDRFGLVAESGRVAHRVLGTDGAVTGLRRGFESRHADIIKHDCNQLIKLL